MNFELLSRKDVAEADPLKFELDAFDWKNGFVETVLKRIIVVAIRENYHFEINCRERQELKFFAAGGVDAK